MNPKYEAPTELCNNLATSIADSDSQTLEEEAQRIQSTSTASSVTINKDKGLIWQQQGFATRLSYHKFTEGCQRVHTLSIRYEKTAPEISHRLQVLKRCLEGLPLTLDNRRIELEAEDAVEEVEMDVEQTRKWKFRFLDLIIEMLLDENGMKEKEVLNVLLYMEVTMVRFRKNLQGNSKGKEVGDKMQRNLDSDRLGHSLVEK